MTATAIGYELRQCSPGCHPVRYEAVRVSRWRRRSHGVRDAHLGVVLHVGKSAGFTRTRAASLNDWEKFERQTV